VVHLVELSDCLAEVVSLVDALHMFLRGFCDEGLEVVIALRKPVVVFIQFLVFNGELRDEFVDVLDELD